MPYSLPAYRRYLTTTTAVLLGLLACSAPALAFNPDEDVPVTTSTTNKMQVLASGTTTPLYAPGSATPTATPTYISPLAPVQMPAKPLYPERTGAVPMAVSTPLAAPALPPVDPAVAAKAQAIIAAEQTATPISTTYYPPAQPTSVAQPLAAPASGFVAPAPVFAVTPTTTVAAPAPAVMTPTPVAAAPVSAMPAPPVPVVAAAAPLPIATPRAELTDETRTILSHVPAALDAPKIQTGSIKMDRVDPEIKEILGSKAQEESFESVGLSIKVRRPGLDTNYELNRAYTALMGGDTQTAIETYKNIISVEPRNEDALFGLAATYHRLGMVEQARPMYGMLLKVNPNHREGLNNFLVLVSDESPQDALPELERLEARNPDFSPIPAQIAIVLDKLGYADQSREKMLRAIELAPDNMTYKYNLAIMLDRRGEYRNAAALYRNLIEASLHGAQVPASTETMQKRLNYIVTEMTSARTAMGQ